MSEGGARDDILVQRPEKHDEYPSINDVIQTQGVNNEGQADPNMEHNFSHPDANENRIDGQSTGDASEGELRRVATLLSQRKQSISHESTYADIRGDPALDVQSGSFDPVKWLRSFFRSFHDKEGGPKNTGILYKNLNVYGSGAALRIQQTVGSYFLAPLRFREHLSFGKTQPRHILHNFDGVLQSGELMIVLGRPGSGCSTLLKTMCGELSGLNVGEDSKVHYNGISQKRMIKEFKGEIVYNQEVRDVQITDCC
jgi:hypothetical protein